MAISPAKDIDAYIARAATEAQPILRSIRQVIAQQVPDATETISYQMPAFRLRKIFIFFAAFKKHIGIYPPLKLEADSRLARKLAPYLGEKGNLRFPLDQPVDLKLIGQVAKALAEQIG